MPKIHVTATINDDAVEYLCEPEQTLLDVLRDELNMTGSKEGCSSGDCGACSVMLDGRLVCSCLVMGAEAEGREERLVLLDPFVAVELVLRQLGLDDNVPFPLPARLGGRRFGHCCEFVRRF